MIFENIKAPRLPALAFMFFCSISGPALAAAVPDGAKAWSGLVHAHYQGISSLKASFEQIITHKESGIEEQREGEFFFRKPFLARWVCKPPYAEVLVVEKDYLWQFFPDDELALKFKVANIDDQSEFLTVLTGQSPLAEKFKIVPKDEIEGVQALHLLPYAPSVSLTEATIWVDTESGNILRLLFVDFYGNLNDIAFTDQEMNKSIADETFQFIPPPGVIVEDYTK